MNQTAIKAIVPGQDADIRYTEYDPWLDLAAAIVKTAVDDYIRIIRKFWEKDLGIKTKRKLLLEKVEMEGFFHSPWYGTLTDIDPDDLISHCVNRAKEQELAAIERRNRKKVADLMRDGK